MVQKLYVYDNKRISPIYVLAVVVSSLSNEISMFLW